MTNAPHPFETILLAIAGLSVLVAGAIEQTNTDTFRQPEAVSVASSTETTIQAPHTDQTDLVLWAMARFEAIGLSLPPLKVVVHEDMAGCDGNAGLYEHGEPARVNLCALDDVTTRPARLITLHELGHAWAEHALDEADRADFLAIRSLNAWIDPEGPSWQWGAEHAAEVISWGLMDEMVPIIRIYDASPEELHEAFQLLVDHAPLVPYAEADPSENATGFVTVPTAEARHHVQGSVTTLTGLPEYAIDSASQSIGLSD